MGLTYLAAWLGLIEYGRLAAGETLLVIGANGGVGSAAAQIGEWRGARVLGVDRRVPLPEASAAIAIDDFFVLDDQPVEVKVRRLTQRRGQRSFSIPSADQCSSRLLSRWHIAGGCLK